MQRLYTSSSASLGNTDVLERILEDENCDVDPVNRLEKATPLHLALKLKDPDSRYETCWHLLDAGADPTYVSISRIEMSWFTSSATSIKDKNGDTALDLLQPGDDELRKMMRKQQAGNSVSKGDIADEGKRLRKQAS